MTCLNIQTYREELKYMIDMYIQSKTYIYKLNTQECKLENRENRETNLPVIFSCHHTNKWVIMNKEEKDMKN